MSRTLVILAITGYFRFTTVKCICVYRSVNMFECECECVCDLPSTIAALWYLEVGGASGCLTALQEKEERIRGKKRRGDEWRGECRKGMESRELLACAETCDLSALSRSDIELFDIDLGRKLS